MKPLGLCAGTVLRKEKPKLDTAKIAQIAANIRGSGAPPEMVESLIQTLSAYIRRFPEAPGRTIAAEREFCLELRDIRKGRPFYLVGRRDWEGTDGFSTSAPPLLGEFKTHRGPWRKSMSIDDMLNGTLKSGEKAEEPGYWDGWRSAWQAAVYLATTPFSEADRPSYEQIYSLMPHNFLVRVAVKPGPYNEADAREKRFHYSPDHHKFLLDGFFHTISQMMDDTESGVFPVRLFSCINRYRKTCPFYEDCHGGHLSLISVVNPSHLDILNSGKLDPAIPAFDVSRVSMYAECPARYKKVYLEHLPEGPNSAYQEGGLFHSALEVLYGGTQCPPMTC